MNMTEYCVEMAAKVLKQFHEQLSIILPIDDLVQHLYSQDLLSKHHKDQLKKLTARDDKIRYFLDDMLDPSIRVGYLGLFDKMLSLMENSDDSVVKFIAKEIQSSLSSKAPSEATETSIPEATETPIPKAGESSMSTKHHMKQQRKQGRRSHKIRSKVGRISLKDVESEYSDGDEDRILPEPKKRRKISKQKPISKKTASMECNLEHYKKKFTEGDVEDSFVYMLRKLEELWSNVEFSILKDACIRDKRLSKELKKNLKSAETLREMLNILSDTPFCSWLEIRILNSMANIADVPEAIHMIKIFKTCVYRRKCSEVIENLRPCVFINSDHLTEVEAKFNKHADLLDVAKLIEYCHKLDSILQLPCKSSTFVDGDIGCLKLHLVIPKYCHLHAYEILKSRFPKLRRLNIQYLQIGSFSKIYTINLTKTVEAKSLLNEISSSDNFAGSHPLQVINHYYTYLEGYMDADSISHMMHCERLITDSDYEAITAAPNDINMNRLLLQYVRAMDMADLLKFCYLLKNIDTHHCIGDNLETSLKLTKYDELAVCQGEHVTAIPSKLMTSQFKNVNTMFLEVIDQLVAQIHTVDVKILAHRCYTLMASDIHNINLFTNSFMKKLFECLNSTSLKINLLSFNTWLDNTILRELTTIYEKSDIFKQFCKFISVIDDTEPITSYPIHTFSQLIIPLDDSEYTIVAIKTFKNCRDLTLRDIKNIKELLVSYWELTAHAIQLAAIDYSCNFIYWMMPKQVHQLVVNKLNKGMHELWHRGIFMAVLLPEDFFSADDGFDHQEINNPFTVSKHVLAGSMKVCSLNFEDIKSCASLLEKENLELLSQLQETNVLQENNYELKSQLEEKQEQLENLEDYSEKLQHAIKVQEENSRLKTRLQVTQKAIRDLDNMKVNYSMLQEDISELKSQLAVTQKQLEVSEKYRELKDKEGCNIAVQTDMSYSQLQSAGIQTDDTNLDEREDYKEGNKDTTTALVKVHKDYVERLIMCLLMNDFVIIAELFMIINFFLATLVYLTNVVMIEQVKTVFFNYFENLIKCLPMNDILFTTQLSKHNLLPGNTSIEIEAMPTQPDKASHFFEHVIKPALDIDDVSNFNSLLSVMEQCDYAHVKNLACKIKSEINERSSIKTANNSNKTLDFTEFEDVSLAFSALFSRLQKEVQPKSDEDFFIIKSACAARANNELSRQILLSRDIDDLFQLFAENKQHCNWLHVYFLEVIAVAYGNIELVDLIKSYKNIVFSKTLYEVWGIHPYHIVRTEYYDKLQIKFDGRDPDSVTVIQLKKMCEPYLIKEIASAFSIIEEG